MPIFILTPVIFMSIFYYMINMYSPVENFLTAIFINIMVVQAAVAMGEKKKLEHFLGIKHFLSFFQES